MLEALAILTLLIGTNPEGGKADNKLAPLERFVGEWAVDAKWVGGQPLKARNVITWALDKKILQAKTFVMDGDREYQRYEAVMAWHPERKSLYEITFAFDGSIGEVLIEAKDKDTLHVGFTPVDPSKPSKVRQVLRFLDNDRFQWIITVQEGQEWKQIMDATWKRTK